MVEGSRFLVPDAYKGRVKDKFEKRASTYDESNEFHPRVVQMLLKYSPLRHGDSVLDVATGTGFVAFEALEVVGSSGSVVGVDISNAMVEQVCVGLCSTLHDGSRFPSVKTCEVVFLPQAVLALKP